MRRDYQIRKVAHARGISLEAYSTEPAVQALATVTKDTEDLLLNFDYPYSTYVEQDMGQHSLRERYGTATLLLHASQAMLNEGFPTAIYSFASEIDGAVSRYGLAVERSTEPDRLDNPPHAVFSPPPEGAWHDSHAADHLSPPSGNYRWWNSRLDPDDLYDHPEFPTNPILPEEREEWLQRCNQEADRLGVPAENLKDPRVIHFLAQLSDARRLLATQEKCREIATEPEGLTPSARERIAEASHLTRAVIMVLEDGLGGKAPLAPADLAHEVNQAAKPYGWQAEPAA
ncbi:hypothetical protein ACFV0O_04305 [Kitasatospora sp. NPDC059577]|uniref:hypothetical protein n=1 Tax=Kitasatospora sp. NPDC059577 TaxID=3346873 RepID=UPI0036B81990